MKYFNFWNNGPVFLELEEDQWSVALFSCNPLDIELKIKEASVNTTFYLSSDCGSLSSLMGLYSDWIKLLKAVAWIIMFRT